MGFGEDGVKWDGGRRSRNGDGGAFEE